MREMSEFVKQEIIDRCIADHDDGPADDGWYTRVDAARIVDVKSGHDAPDNDGICPTCGRLSSSSDQYAALPRRERIGARACHERADWVVELLYHVEEANNGHFIIAGQEYGAVYGVTLQGDRLDIVLWMD